jgi:hypothetical protein
MFLWLSAGSEEKGKSFFWREVERRKLNELAIEM